MSAELIMDALNLLTDDILQETDALRQRKEKRRGARLRWTVAACFAILFCAGAALVYQTGRARKEGPDSDVSAKEDLPMLTIFENMAEGMGFEGYMAFDISELVNENPWREDMELDRLPVYENPLELDENFIAQDADPEEMRAFLLEIAGRAGLDADTLSVTDDVPSESLRRRIIEKFQATGEDVPEGYFHPTRLRAEAEGMAIEVDQVMTAQISFEPAILLPEQYRCAFYASYEEKAAAADYLRTEFADIINLQNPQTEVYGGDYDIYLHQRYKIAFFDSADSDAERIVNYNFYRTVFYCDEGKLDLIRIFHPDLSRKLGDYPVISAGEAKELLLDGNYITSVPYAMPGAEYVKRTELVYRAGEQEKYFLPYYRFYVELPEEAEAGLSDGLKTYGAYYVPAVRGEYISNMPVGVGRNFLRGGF